MLKVFAENVLSFLTKIATAKKFILSTVWFRVHYVYVGPQSFE